MYNDFSYYEEEYAKIVEILEKDYDHEQPDIPRSKEFNRAYRNEVRRLIKPYGYELVSEKGSTYCGSSGTITDGKGNEIYFNSGDYRYDGDRIFERVLVRLNNKGNYYCPLRDIGKACNELFEIGGLASYY